MQFELEPHHHDTPDEVLINDLQRVARVAGIKAVSFRLYSKLGKYHPSTLALRFGTWNGALKAAALEILSERDISDERLFENVLHLWEHFGRQPRFRDLSCPPSTISVGPYQRRFGSWIEALKHFVEYANSQDVREVDPIERTKGHMTGRSPSLRLRFRVLKRDSFKCCACGASPASTPGLVLHVDHIKAWSLGGETVEDNLQTLCEPCNLGKSNVL
jgi:hypothetical protein